MEISKIICLMPAKNEAEILPVTLDIISQYCDVIIISDQMSTDNSREIYKQYKKIEVIENKRIGHSNEVRWDLLSAARQYDGNNLILCLDADEFIPFEHFKKFLEDYPLNKGDSYKFPWIQLWKSINKYNDSGVWKNNFKSIAWFDDRSYDYDKNFVINDHTTRIPEAYLKKNYLIKSVPIIHLQWVFWQKAQLKQAWYRCTEFIKNGEIDKINLDYSITLDSPHIKLKSVKPEWVAGIKLNNKDNEFDYSWHLSEIFELFNKYGIEYFEPLQIWHIEILLDEFTKKTNRRPIAKKIPLIKKNLNNLNIKMRNLIKTIKYS